MGADATKVLYVPLTTMPDVTIVMRVFCTGPAWVGAIVDNEESEGKLNEYEL